MRVGSNLDCSRGFAGIRCHCCLVAIFSWLRSSSRISAASISGERGSPRVDVVLDLLQLRTLPRACRTGLLNLAGQRHHAVHGRSFRSCGLSFQQRPSALPIFFSPGIAEVSRYFGPWNRLPTNQHGTNLDMGSITANSRFARHTAVKRRVNQSVRTSPWLNDPLSLLSMISTASGACERKAHLCRKKRFLGVLYTRCPQI